MTNLLTSEWLIPKAIAGLIIGYTLRMHEHYAWAKETNYEMSTKQFMLFSFRLLAEAITAGLPIAYYILLLIAKSIPDQNIIEVSAYLLSIFWCFMAGEFRGLTRRISRI
jgi:hypothetical protein